MSNQYIQNILDFGLKMGETYNDIKNLRYGSIMLMADQDQLGEHRQSYKHSPADKSAVFDLETCHHFVNVAKRIFFSFHWNHFRTKLQVCDEYVDCFRASDELVSRELY